MPVSMMDCDSIAFNLCYRSSDKMDIYMTQYKQQDTNHDDSDCSVTLSASPFVLFDEWFNHAVESKVVEPHTMVVSTVIDNQPSSRCVYLSEILEQEFIFYTNYGSNKAQALENNPKVALLFNWPQSHRQVRIEGLAHHVATAVSDRYFSQRKRQSQLASILSKQSKPLASRDDLVKALETQMASTVPVSRPTYWGGFAIKPKFFNFLVLKPSRLHESYNYSFVDSAWQVQAVYP